MRRTGRLTLAVGGALLLATTVAPPALADPEDAAVQALRSGSVYVGAAAPMIDRSQLGASVLDGIKVAIVPPGGPDPEAVARDIGARLDPDSKGLTVLVFEGHAYGAASSAHCGVGAAINQAVASNRSTLTSTDNVTSTVRDFASAVHAAPGAGNGCSDSSSSSFGTQAKTSSHTGLIVFLVIVALVLGGIGLFVASRRRRRRRELSDARSAVMPYYERLANEVNTIEPGDDATARQAMADAAERFNVAGGQLAVADSVAKYAHARRTVLEGLYAARTARSALKLDPGPALPPVVEGAGEQLDRPREISVQGQTYQGYPGYTPGAPYYFGGGYGIPGGWYGSPFWEGLLIGDLLGGGFGGGFGGGWGGYGAGYDNGYLTGYDAGGGAGAGDSGADVGSGWGDSGGGGDWSGGGWGDAGGGDWGGGGDFGGGDSGGGSW